MKEILRYLDDTTFLKCMEVDNLRKLYEQDEINYRKYHDKYLYDLIMRGDLDGVKYYKADVTQADLNETIRYGHISLVDYMIHTLGIECNSYAFDWAAYDGRLEMVKYLCDNNIYGTSHSLEWACCRNRYNIVKYLCCIRDVPLRAKDVEVAAKSADIKLIRLIHFLGYHFNKTAIKYACARKDLNILKFFASIKIDLSEGVIMACSKGVVSNIDFILHKTEHKIKVDDIIDCLAVAKKNHKREVINYLLAYCKTLP